MNKAELIRHEIEKRREHNLAIGNPLFSAMAEEDIELLSFIDSLQEEPVNKDLEKAIDTYLKSYWGGEKEKQEWPFLKKMVIFFAQWQKEQLMAKAIDGKVIANGMGNPILHLWDKGRHLIGKKVKVILIKEE